MTTTDHSEVPVRDAATIILIRDPASRPSVLMGQRGKGAVFMPNKMVFPGGRVDRGDAAIPLQAPLPDRCRDRLSADTLSAPETLAATAIRELWEETGAVLGRPADWPDAPPDWRDFAATGHRPAADALSFVFRAVTPPGRPRRFDARFFLADAAALTGDPDALPDATDELSHIRWVPLDDAEALDLAFITRLVLAEVHARLPRIDAPDRVPFVKNDSLDSEVVWL